MLSITVFTVWYNPGGTSWSFSIFLEIFPGNNTAFGVLISRCCQYFWIFLAQITLIYKSPKRLSLRLCINSADKTYGNSTNTCSFGKHCYAYNRLAIICLVISLACVVAVAPCYLTILILSTMLSTFEMPQNSSQFLRPYGMMPFGIR